MPKETQNKEIEAMFRESIEKYKKPAKIWKTFIKVLFVGFVVVALILMATGAIVWLSVFFD